MENNFASNLKHLRVQAGMTQLELAKKLDKDYSTIGKWELGQRSPMMIDLIRIAELFDVSLENLIGVSVTNNGDSDDLLSQYKTLFDKDNKLTSVQKEFIMNTIKEQHRKIDEGLEKGNVN